MNANKELIKTQILNLAKELPDAWSDVTAQNMIKKIEELLQKL